MMSRNYGLSLYDWDSDGMEDNPRWGAWAKYEDVQDLIEEMIDTHQAEEEALISEIDSLESQLEKALSQINQQMDGD